MDNIFNHDDNITPTPQEAKAPPRKLNTGNDKDRAELWNLYKARALLNHPEAFVTPYTPPPKESNVLRDSAGNYAGVKHSVMSGIHATVKNQTDLLRALKARVKARYGVED